MLTKVCCYHYSCIVHLCYFLLLPYNIWNQTPPFLTLLFNNRDPPNTDKNSSPHFILPLSFLEPRNCAWDRAMFLKKRFVYSCYPTVHEPEINEAAAEAPPAESGTSRAALGEAGSLSVGTWQQYYLPPLMMVSGETSPGSPLVSWWDSNWAIHFSWPGSSMPGALPQLVKAGSACLCFPDTPRLQPDFLPFPQLLLLLRYVLYFTLG